MDEPTTLSLEILEVKQNLIGFDPAEGAMVTAGAGLEAFSRSGERGAGKRTITTNRRRLGRSREILLVIDHASGRLHETPLADPRER